MRRTMILAILTLASVLLGGSTLLGERSAVAQIPAADLTPALLDADDVPAGWEHAGAWDWECWTVCDSPYTSLSRATGRGLGENAVSMSFAAPRSELRLYIHRGMQQAVVALPPGMGAVGSALLRNALHGCSFDFREPDGAVMSWTYTVLDAPLLGEEALALGIQVVETPPGLTAPMTEGSGVFYAIRRGDYLALLRHFEGGFRTFTRDDALGDALARRADERLAALAAGIPLTPTGVTPPGGAGANEASGDDGPTPWLFGAMAGLLLLGALGTLLAVRSMRPHPAPRG